MRLHNTTSTLVVLAAATLTVASTSTTQPAETTVYTLPADGDAAVLMMDDRGGMMRRVSEEPLLIVQADGTVRLGAPYGTRQALVMKISGDEMQALLRTVLETHAFEKVDVEKIKKQIAGKERRVHISDAGLPVVEVTLPKHKHRAEMYAMQFQARQHPDIAELQDFAAVVLHLERFMGVQYAGGADGVAKRLEAINKALAAKHKDAPALEAKDLRQAVRLNDGSLSIGFHRERKLEDGDWRITSASARFPAEEDGEPRIHVSYREITEPLE